MSYFQQREHSNFEFQVQKEIDDNMSQNQRRSSQTLPFANRNSDARSQILSRTSSINFELQQLDLNKVDLLDHSPQSIFTTANILNYLLAKLKDLNQQNISRLDNYQFQRNRSLEYERKNTQLERKNLHLQNEKDRLIQNSINQKQKYQQQIQKLQDDIRNFNNLRKQFSKKEELWKKEINSKQLEADKLKNPKNIPISKPKVKQNQIKAYNEQSLKNVKNILVEKYTKQIEKLEEENDYYQQILQILCNKVDQLMSTLQIHQTILYGDIDSRVVKIPKQQRYKLEGTQQNLHHINQKLTKCCQLIHNKFTSRIDDREAGERYQDLVLQVQRLRFLFKDMQQLMYNIITQPSRFDITDYPTQLTKFQQIYAEDENTKNTFIQKMNLYKKMILDTNLGYVNLITEIEGKLKTIDSQSRIKNKNEQKIQLLQKMFDKFQLQK